MSEKNKCNCKYCELHTLRTKALESNDVEFIKKVMVKFSDLWLNADEDLNYHVCILDGSWPSSEKILTESLEKAKNHPNRSLE